MSAIIKAMRPRVTDAKVRQQVYEAIIPAMQDGDWDTECECIGEDEAYDAALKTVSPSLFEPD